MSSSTSPSGGKATHAKHHVNFAVDTALRREDSDTPQEDSGESLYFLKPLDVPQPVSPLRVAAEEVPSEIMVSLLDRAAEMRELLEHNSSFFRVVRQTLHEPERYEDFERMLLMPREQLNDKLWMRKLCQEYLPNLPLFQEELKSMVGYDELRPEDVQHFSREIWAAESMVGEGADVWVNLVRIRDYPERVQHFRREHEHFSRKLAEHFDEYAVHLLPAESYLSCARFWDVFTASRDAVSDEKWEKEVLQHLDTNVDLRNAFKELVAYEVADAEEADAL